MQITIKNKTTKTSIRQKRRKKNHKNTSLLNTMLAFINKTTAFAKHAPTETCSNLSSWPANNQVSKQNLKNKHKISKKIHKTNAKKLQVNQVTLLILSYKIQVNFQKSKTCAKN